MPMTWGSIAWPSGPCAYRAQNGRHLQESLTACSGDMERESVRLSSPQFSHRLPSTHPLRRVVYVACGSALVVRSATHYQRTRVGDLLGSLKRSDCKGYWLHNALLLIPLMSECARVAGPTDQLSDAHSGIPTGTSSIIESRNFMYFIIPLPCPLQKQNFIFYLNFYP